MAQIPLGGSEGEIWTVHVPIVFDVAARSWQQATAIVEQAVTGRVAALAPAGPGQEGILSWSHRQDSYPSRDTSQSMRQSLLADLTTVEVLRVLVDSQAQQLAGTRTLTEEELQQVQLTLAATDRYVQIANPEFPESGPLFAGHATEAAAELPEGLYDATDIAGRETLLFIGASRFTEGGKAAATLPVGNVDSRALTNVARALQTFDRTQQPSAVLEQVSAIVFSAGHEGLNAGELLAARAAATRPAPVTVAVIDWTDDPEIEPTVLVGMRSAELVREAANQVHAELRDSEAFAGATDFLDTHSGPAQWRIPEDVDAWLAALSAATPYPRVTITQQQLAGSSVPGQQIDHALREALAQREAALQPDPGSTSSVSTSHHEQGRAQ